MSVATASFSSASEARLLWLCVAGSVAMHALVLTLLPGWKALRESPPRPLTVELLKQEPPEIVPPKPLPVLTPPHERATTAVQKPDPVTRPRDERPVESPRTQVLTAPPEAPVTAATPSIPESKPAPAEVPRAQPSPPPAAVTPPRSEAAHLNNPPPAYPLAAQRRGDHGTVLLRLVVTADGLAKNVTVEKSSGHRALDDAALAAVRNWRFVPARQGGQTIDWPYTQAIVFKPSE